MLTSPYKKVTLLPPAEHPRVMLRASDLDRIRKNFEHPDNARAVHFYRELCASLPRFVTAPESKPIYDLKDCLIIEAKALSALLSGDYAEKRAVFELIKYPLTHEGYAVCDIMNARYSGHVIFLSALIYDWCYDALTDEEKSFIIERCEHLAETCFEMGYPPVRQMAISGHGSEAQLLRDLLSFSIAVYDERPDIYEFCAGRIFAEYVSEYEIYFKPGFHPQGPAYGSYRHTSALWSGLLFLSMSGERIYAPSMEYLCDGYLAMVRADGQAVRLGDDFNESKAEFSRFHPFTVPMFLAAAYGGEKRYFDYYKANVDDEYLVPTKTGRDYYRDGSFGEGLFSPSVQLIWYGKTPLKGGEPLPVAKHFGDFVGVTVYNDGERVVLMKAGCFWTANHDHLDPGCFQVYYKAPLATDSGVYGNYGHPHRMNYLIHTVAHNCLTVFDPEKPSLDGWGTTAYSGGTRRPGGGREPRTTDILFSENRMAYVLAHEESEGGCSLKVDLSPAYCHSCESVVRTMVFDANAGEKGILTVTDEVTSIKPESKKTFNLHCLVEPRIENGEIIIENGEGKLVCRVLSEDCEIALVGGKDRGFMAGDVNFEPIDVGDAEIGWGRIEISPKKEGKTHKITVEMEIMDA